MSIEKKYEKEPKPIYKNTCNECERIFETYYQFEKLCIRCQWEKRISDRDNTCARCGNPLKDTNIYCHSCMS